MASKKVSFGTKPKTKPSVDDWVESREAPTADDEQPVVKSSTPAAPTKPKAEESAKEPMKRLTLDIPESLHRKIKGQAVMEGVTMVNMLRELLEETYR